MTMDFGIATISVAFRSSSRFCEDPITKLEAPVFITIGAPAIEVIIAARRKRVPDNIRVTRARVTCG